MGLYKKLEILGTKFIEYPWLYKKILALLLLKTKYRLVLFRSSNKL